MSGWHVIQEENRYMLNYIRVGWAQEHPHISSRHRYAPAKFPLKEELTVHLWSRCSASSVQPLATSNGPRQQRAESPQAQLSSWHLLAAWGRHVECCSSAPHSTSLMGSVCSRASRWAGLLRGLPYAPTLPLPSPASAPSCQTQHAPQNSVPHTAARMHTHSSSPTRLQNSFFS